MRRGVKIAISVTLVVIALIAIAIPVYFNFKDKTIYRLNDVSGVTKLTISDFTSGSEMQLYKNGTFHLHIELKEKGTILSAIGEYQMQGKTYKLTFTKAYADDADGNFIDYTEQFNTDNNEKITCTRSGNRIMLTDHKGQIFYFG